MKSNFLYSYCLLLLLCFVGCSEKTQAGLNSTEATPPTISINRFDKKLYSYLQTPNPTQERELKEEYSDFLLAFGIITISRPNINEELFFPSLQKYFSNEMLHYIYTDALKTFDDVSAYEQELANADLLIAQNFNQKRLPILGMHISGFKENTIVLENYISISIDKYLGKDYPAYLRFFEEYQRRQMEPKFVVRDFIKAWLLSEKTQVTKKRNLSEEIIEEGKNLYVLSIALPNWKEADLIGYTEEQMAWCTEKEVQIWKALIQGQFLFNKDPLTIQKFIGETSFTTPLSSDSPGRVGAWVGWQIVQHYMKQTNSSLANLMNTDAQTILKESKYNPN
ncbi:hypothetical protein M2132_001355 [Dysgonomonas sp. PH5-45]|uniref:gliding motility lipoprotein GldB n=1 Tax=unclassified Dysgonomonas TaxID=2630389 RepID=UPI002474BD97|nr:MULTISPECIES: DUF2268 domain-containing putative Zn-dependent protease [unclassified Dysgonomonas]MDH6355018.1 hypothetical protein [Dysgonomonas sp. PH5-45]MDH6387857.1 hypothetical protein [Dysgonomonas sp. PH5-37]